jgi:hypothetical protein
MSSHLQINKSSVVGDWIHALPDTAPGAGKELDAVVESGDFDKIDEEMWSEITTTACSSFEKRLPHTSN